MNHFMLVFMGYSDVFAFFQEWGFHFQRDGPPAPMIWVYPNDDFDDMTNRNEQLKNRSHPLPHNPTIPPSNNPSLHAVWRNFVFFGSRL